MSNASEETYNKETAQTIVTFLKSSLSKTDVPNIQAELKKDFVLGKRKSKGQKRKPKKKKKQCLTKKEKKALGFYSIPRNSIRYQDVLPMYKIWLGYMDQLLELDNPIPDCTSKSWEMFTQSIYKADFHGSMLKVIRSKCPSFVDKMGICIMDTRNTFKIVSMDNVVTTIPKKENVFELYLRDKKITFFGKHLCVRPAERSTKKVKVHSLPDL